MANHKKTEKEKELQGTTRPDRNTTALDQQPARPLPLSFPEPPDWISDDAKKVYCELARHVNRVKALWDIDHMAIGQAATWIVFWRENINSAMNNPVQTFDSGVQQISPQIVAIEKAESRILKYFEILGIGPKSRESIGLFKSSGGSEESDPVQQLISKYTNNA